MQTSLDHTPNMLSEPATDILNFARTLQNSAIKLLSFNQKSCSSSPDFLCSVWCGMHLHLCYTCILVHFIALSSCTLKCTSGIHRMEDSSIQVVLGLLYKQDLCLYYCCVVTTPEVCVCSQWDDSAHPRHLTLNSTITKLLNAISLIYWHSDILFYNSAFRAFSWS